MQSINRIALLGALIGLIAFHWPFVILHPNRVMPMGEPYDLLKLPSYYGYVAAGGWISLAISSFLPISTLKKLFIAISVTTAVVMTCLALGLGTAHLAEGNEYARLRIGSGAWITLLASYVAIFAVYDESRRLSLIPLLATVLVLVIIPLKHLGIMQEYITVADVFRGEFIRHMQLVMATLPITICLGIPLGVFAARKPNMENSILGVASFLQTIPSVALFGLLLPVLSFYGRHTTVGFALLLIAVFVILSLLIVYLLKRYKSRLANLLSILFILSGILILLPFVGQFIYQLIVTNGRVLSQTTWATPLAELGVRGLGSAPAIVALTLYGLLPLIANTHTGIKGVATGIVEAARGMGMSPIQVFYRVELPMAMPFIIQGIRGTLLLLIGLAAVAVLVNAGGLGYFLMRGMEQSVLDLVLLGALPIVLLALGSDILTRLLGWAIIPKGLRP